MTRQALVFVFLAACSDPLPTSTLTGDLLLRRSTLDGQTTVGPMQVVAAYRALQVQTYDLSAGGTPVVHEGSGELTATPTATSFTIDVQPDEIHRIAFNFRALHAEYSWRGDRGANRDAHHE